jgi:hypothetical protein
MLQSSTIRFTIEGNLLLVADPRAATAVPFEATLVPRLDTKRVGTIGPKRVKPTHEQGSSVMMQFGITTAAVGFLTIAGLSLANTAAAGNQSAADAIANLQAKGHHVQLNGSANVPLSLCKVTGVHGLNNSNIDPSGSRIDEDLFTTVYVDVDCQDG